MQALAAQQLAALEGGHWWFRGRRAVCLGLLEAVLDGERPARVLDLGAGAGGFLSGLEALGGRVHHLDRDPTLLRRCRSRGFGGGVAASGAALPFADGVFDLVCLFDVIEHIPDDRGVMAEVARVLAPGGRVFLHVPAHPWLFAQNDRISGHERRHTRPSLRALAEGAGLAVERLTGTNVLLFPAIAAVVMVLKGLEAWGLGRRRPHTNLSWRLPGWANELCARTFAAELALSRRFDLPVGHSLALVARRPAG